MNKILQYLFEHKTLTQQQARDVMLKMARGDYNDTSITAFITVFLMRSIRIEELQGFRDGLMELAMPVDLSMISSPVLLKVPAMGCTMAFPSWMTSCASGDDPINL